MNRTLGYTLTKIRIMDRLELEPKIFFFAGGIAVHGTANGQNGSGKSNGANGGITVNGNLPTGCKVALNGKCFVK